MNHHIERFGRSLMAVPIAIFVIVFYACVALAELVMREQEDHYKHDNRR